MIQLIIIRFRCILLNTLHTILCEKIITHGNQYHMLVKSGKKHIALLFYFTRMLSIVLVVFLISLFDIVLL